LAEDFGINGLRGPLQFHNKMISFIVAGLDHPAKHQVHTPLLAIFSKHRLRNVLCTHFSKMHFKNLF
jgi:hypothetical protein